MTSAKRVVFLLDADDTLLDNDAAQNEYLQNIKRNFGKEIISRQVLENWK